MIRDDMTQEELNGAKKFISDLLVGELGLLSAKKTTMTQFNELVDTLQRYSFTEEHPTFFHMVRNMAYDIDQNAKKDE